MTRLDLRGTALRGTAGRTDLADVLPRATFDIGVALDTVRPICDDVRARGDVAVQDATERFDGIRPPQLRVPPEVIVAAGEALEPDVRAALTESIRRARLVHAAQRRDDVTVEVAPGSTVTERWVPVGRVGLYVPGGRFVYPSSVVMNVVAAQEAGVGSLAVTSPAQKDHGGLPHPVILGACALLGVDEVYAAGGAQAIAMLAYGTESCSRVDVVTGPGNVYVTAAKRFLQGVVGVDAEAGPTEVAILADDTADPSHVAADLIAQAEHDPLAACLLVTPSVELADAVDVELDKQVPATNKREIVEASLAGQSATVLVDDLDDGVHVVDVWAAEHLEIQTVDAAAVAARIRNAGAIFIGAYTPVALGDYIAGSNHVLPSGGTARHTGGLSVSSFQRQIHVVQATKEALAQVAAPLTALAKAEGLLAHGDSVAARFR